MIITRAAAARYRRSPVALICYTTSMTKEVTLRQAGGSVSATLPKDMADRLRLEAGDRVLAVETDRGILLTPYDPEVERALNVAAKAAKKYRNALRELGGLSGVRDENALESALARPQQKWHYDTGVDLPTLAAAYAFGLVRNH